MTEPLPEPLVPAEVDLRDAPFPIMDMACGFSTQFGCLVEAAADAFRTLCRANGQRTDEDLIQ